ncbi:MAG: DUF2380 domain-containing protein [Candidatus Methylacidiphilaceae bacterium]
MRRAAFRSVLATILACCGLTYTAWADPPSASPSHADIKIALFPFELEDIAAAAKPGSGPNPTESSFLTKATEETKQALLNSGRYTVIDASGVDAGAAANHELRNCHGCEAAIANQLGADQALVGVILRPEMVEYGVKIWITDAKTGRSVAAYALRLSLGGPESWPSGVRTVMRRLMAPAQTSVGTKVP